MTENKERLLNNSGHSGRETLHCRRIEVNDVNAKTGVELMVHDGYGGSGYCNLTIPECEALAIDLLAAAQDLRELLLRK